MCRSVNSLWKRTLYLIHCFSPETDLVGEEQCCAPPETITIPPGPPARGTCPRSHGLLASWDTFTIYLGSTQFLKVSGDCEHRTNTNKGSTHPRIRPFPLNNLSKKKCLERPVSQCFCGWGLEGHGQESSCGPWTNAPLHAPQQPAACNPAGPGDASNLLSALRHTWESWFPVNGQPWHWEPSLPDVPKKPSAWLSTFHFCIWEEGNLRESQPCLGDPSPCKEQNNMHRCAIPDRLLWLGSIACHL